MLPTFVTGGRWANGQKKSHSRAPLSRVALGGVVGALLGGCATFSAPRYEGPVSDHFDGRKFLNLEPFPERQFRDVVRYFRTRDPGPWQKWTDAPPGPRPPERVGAGEMRVTFINHATVLLQQDGLNILTDPIWSDRAGPLSWLGTRRRRPVGIRFEDLPPIHAVVISHNHYDHLDLQTLKRLSDTFGPRVFAGLGNRRLLEAAGIKNVTDLDWWQDAPLAEGVTVTAVPARHWSGRGTRDSSATLWCGYVIRGPSGSAYFSGDTGLGRHFEAIGEKFGPLRLAILPIGAFRPTWFMGPVHTSPTDAVKAHVLLRASTSVGVHFGTFRLADDGQYEPVTALKSALEASGIPADRFWALGFGEGRQVP